jgi:ubiquinone/menaquinone biosynthesis C-methylase UbiE
MTKMGSKSRYDQQQTAQHYEEYYETKYKRADLLEKKLLPKLFSEFPGARNALEVGCGTAHFARWVESALGLECFGVDSSKAMLGEAKKRWPGGNLLQSNGCQMPFKDKSVDIVFFLTSLEYMPDSASAIREAARIAKKGIIFGLMNKNSSSTLRKRVQALIQKKSFYQKAKFYSYSDIKTILDKELQEKNIISFHSTTVFPSAFGDLESSRFQFGAFLGLAVTLRDINE